MTDTETILIDDVENKRIDVYPSEEHLSCERANAVDRSMSLFQALTSHQGQRISTPTDDAIRPRSTGKSRKKEISLTTFLLLSIFGRRRRSAGQIGDSRVQFGDETTRFFVQSFIIDGDVRLRAGGVFVITRRTRNERGGRHFTVNIVLII